MQTRCPHCQLVSPLEADRPSDQRGLFECPACGTRFDAYAHLTDAAPGSTAPDEAAAAHRDQGDLFVRPTRPAPTEVPRFVRQRVRGDRPSQWRWWLAGFALLLVLLGIVPIADRDELARDAQWRPRVQRLCHAVGCALPPWNDASKFTVTAREINKHPSAANAWLIRVSFRNDATFEQAWPLIELTASDLNGRVIGMRRFHPKEYLGSAPETQRIEAGQSASATLEVVDPGAVSWDIEFR